MKKCAKPDRSVRLTDSVGKLYGHYKDKNNRARKLIDLWPVLTSKMQTMVLRGKGQTLQARLAYAVLLMMETGIRVGNEESAEGFVSINKWSEHHGKEVKTFGLTTLRNEHVGLRRGKMTLRFVGKKIVDQELTTTNPFLIQYAPHVGNPVNVWLNVTYPELYKFVKKYVGRQFKPKDIRTAKVNMEFVRRFLDDSWVDVFTAAAKKSDRNKAVSGCVEATAEAIGHTPGVCRKSYLSCHLLNALKSYTPPDPVVK